MKILNHVIECNFHGRRKWSDVRMYKRIYYRHFVWGKISLLFGQPHLIPITVCCECYEATSEISHGDEGWTYCEGCGAVEPRTEEITTEEYDRISK